MEGTTMSQVGTAFADLLASRSLAPGLDDVLARLADTCAVLAGAVRRGILGPAGGQAGATNASGEAQQALDVYADMLFQRELGACAEVAGLASEELDAPQATGSHGRYLLVYDPLDGSSNIAVNGTIGTIFSVLPAPAGRTPEAADFLQPGSAQVAAGFCIYGPATVLVLSTGQGAQAYTLDPASGRFALTLPALRIPETTREFAINASNQRHWEEPVQRYVAECLAGKTGPREVDFNMRWVASMVADVYRVLVRGGVFLYPRDRKDPGKPGKLRLMYEASPMAYVVEQAGGLACDGRRRLLDIVPTDVHQRAAVILGSREEVERLSRYHGCA
jgi:fructose-1,6-bisphosphatase